MILVLPLDHAGQSCWGQGLAQVELVKAQLDLFEAHIFIQSINCFLKPRPWVIITRDAKKKQGYATIAVRMECVVEKDKKKENV